MPRKEKKPAEQNEEAKTGFIEFVILVIELARRFPNGEPDSVREAAFHFQRLVKSEKK